MNAIVQNTEKLTRHVELVQRAQAGDRAALGDLFTQFRPVVLAIIARRVKDAGDAEELTQDVFVKVLEKLDQLRQAEAFPGWVKSIAVRLSLNFVQRRRVALVDQLGMVGELDEQSPTETAIARERADTLRSGLDQLRALDRETLHAFYIDGKSILEMADEFEAPIGTIKRRLHVARQRLAGEVEMLASA
ncbi:MAG TPA: sigma-70 family RNA polymerase sigma factor [Pirellulaceae bacterium]|nr:sigma-70 family RNA polymerase sigma factor [Pirellulaceae bacterium]